MTRLGPGPTVFAVEDDRAQVVWRSLPRGELTVECGTFRTVVESDGGPGAVDVTGLAPDTAQQLVVSAEKGVVARRSFRTLAPPPGEELFRFATVSDLHLGRTTFGVRHLMAEPLATEPHPIRCARAAFAELQAWGARALVIKGDLVDHNSDGNWELAAGLLRNLPIPVFAVPGNHETAHGDDRAFERAAVRGIALTRTVDAVDLDGIRLVLMNSALEGIDIGRWHHLRDDVRDAAAEAAGPAMVLTHHQPQVAPIPLHFPPGINSITAGRFARTLARANPATMGSSGHTHRNRRRTVAGIPWTEVGSTKDHPGVWAGYVVHEGGIRQVVRRVVDPGCLDWLDHTRHAAGGLWGWWSPGHLDDRCFTHRWPARSGHRGQ